MWPADWSEMVIDADNRRYVFEFAAGYFASAILLFVWSMRVEIAKPIEDVHD